MKLRKYIIITIFFILVYVISIVNQFNSIKTISEAVLDSVFNSFKETASRVNLRIEYLYNIFESLDAQRISQQLSTIIEQEHIYKIIVIKGDYVLYIMYNNEFANKEFIEINNMKYKQSSESADIAFIVNLNNSFIRHKYVYKDYIIYTYTDFKYISSNLFLSKLIKLQLHSTDTEHNINLVSSSPLDYPYIKDQYQKLHIEGRNVVFVYYYKLSHKIYISNTTLHSLLTYQYIVYMLLYISFLILVGIFDYYRSLSTISKSIVTKLEVEIFNTKKELENFERDVYKSSLDSLKIGIVIYNNSNQVLYINPYILQYGDIEFLNQYLQESSVIIKNTIFNIQTYPLIIKDKQSGTITILTDVTDENIYKESLLISKKVAEENEKIYRTFFEMSPDAIIITQENKITYINNAGLQLYQYNHIDEIIDLPITMFIHSQDIPLIFEKMHQLFSDRNAMFDPIVYKFLNKNGEIIYGETKGTFILFNNKPAVVSVIRDVSKSYKEIQQLHLLNKAIQVIPLGVTITNINHDIIYTNTTEAILHGYAHPNELLGKSARIFSPENQWHNDEKLYGHTNSLKKIRESVNIKKDGNIFPVKLTSEVIFGADNNIIGIVTISEDISVKKKIDLELLRLKKAIDTIQIGITITNSENLIIYANQADATIHGYDTPDELIGKSSTIYDPHELINTSTKKDTIIHAWKRESINITKNQREFPVEITSSDIYDDSNYVGRVSICSDITERKEQELKLIISERQFKLLFQQSPIGFVEFNFVEVKKYINSLKNTYNIINYAQFFKEHPLYFEECINRISIIQVNQACTNIFSTTYTDINQLILSFIRINSTQFQQDLHEFLYNESYIAHNKYRTTTALNKELYIDTYLTILAKNGGQWSSVLLSIIDVTKKTLLEEEYRTLSYAIHNSANAILITDVKGNITYCNPSFLSMSEYSFDEVLHKNPRIIKSGKQDNSFYQELWQTISSGNIWQGEIINKTKYGTYYTEFMTITPVINSENIITSYIAVKVDITQKKYQESLVIEQEKKYKDLYYLMRRMTDNVVDLIWAKNLNKEYIFANKAICTNLLCVDNADDVIGKTDIFFAQKERNSHPLIPTWHTFGELCQDSDEVIINTKESARFDEYGNVKNELLYLDVYKAPLLNDNNEMIGIVGSARIVTEQRKLEQEKERALQQLKVSELEIRTALYEAPFPIILYNKDGIVKIMSKCIEELLGITLNNTTYNIYTIANKLHLNIDLFSKEMIDDILMSKVRKYYGEYLITISNDQSVLQQKIWDIYSAAYGETQIMFIAFDITDRKYQEYQVLYKNNLLQTIIDTIPDPISVKDINLRYIAVNRAYLSYFDMINVQDIIGKTDEMLSHNILELNFDESYVLDNEQIILNKEEVMYTINGETIWVLSSHIPLYDQNRKLNGVLSYYKNVHDVKTLLNENEKLKEQYKFLAHQTAQFLEQINSSYEQQHHYSIPESSGN